MIAEKSCNPHAKGFTAYFSPADRLPANSRLRSKYSLRKDHGCQKTRAVFGRRHAGLKDQESETPVSSPLDLDSEQFPFSLPKRPKFNPFVGQDERSERLKAFRYTADVKGGTLFVRPLSEDWLSSATQLLTESFADSVGYMPMYKGFLRRQVDDYLRSHIDIAPKAVVLEALLLHPGTSVADIEGQAEDKPAVDGENRDTERDGSSEATGTDGVGPGATAAPENRLQDKDAASSENPEDDLDQSRLSNVEDHPEDYVDPDETFTKFSSAKSDEISESEGEDENVPTSAFRDLAVDDATQEDSEQVDSSVDSSQDQSFAVQGSESFSGSSASEEREKEHLGELIGTVELSFVSATRQRQWTLNPPEDSAYLCNMAVAEHHQRKGYGSEILKAAEQVVRLAGFRRVWLHVRLKDEPARALYERGGFGLEKEDCWLVSLFEDRRRLLSKFIPQDPKYRAADSDQQEEEPELQTEY